MLHRNALFTLASSDNLDNNMVLNEVLEEQDVSNLINWRNASGSSLLHEACMNNLAEKALLLMRKGAVLQQNGKGEMPIVSLVKFLEEDQVRVFLEKLQTEVSVSDFVKTRNSADKDPFEWACLKGDWHGALSLHAVGASSLTGNQQWIDEIPMGDGRGIQYIVECPALQPLLEFWSSASEEEKGKAKKKINAFFFETVRVLFIPADEMEDSKEHKLRRIVKEWNSANNNKGIVEF